MALLDLPNELIIQIISNLPHQDIIACQLSNKLLHTIIKDSVLLQFQIALSTFKVIDNPSCPLSLSERFQALKDYEDSWSYLHKDFKRNVPINHNVSGIYDLTGGVFLLGGAGRTALHYIKLPSSICDGVEWKTIQLDHSEGTIIDMGFCLVEHDLLVVVTTKPRHNESQVITYDIKLVLLKLSTGKPHPAAKESTILVINSQWDRPGIAVEVVGDRLVLILSYHNNHWRPHDRVFIYDWRNAVQKLSFAVPYSSYSGLVFLSENLIVIPNARTNVLEIWDLSSIPKTPHPACILQLPEPYTGNMLIYITCRGEPNPIGSGSQLPSDKPFYHSAQDAIILFHINVQLGGPIGHQQLHGGGFIGRTYTIFVHRKALCEVYERYCADMNNKSGDESLGMPDISGQPGDSGFEDSGLDEIVIDDDDSDDWESMGSDNEDDMPIRLTEEDPTPIPWSSWGPLITRWFPADTNSTRWITTTSGQRGVLIGQSRHGASHQYVILDFNPENIRRMEKKMEFLPFDIESRLRCSRDLEDVPIEGVFREPVVSELPFVSCISEKVYAWSGALMDEERVLGIKLDSQGHMRVIEVHHFGRVQE